jgi:hypothetical protein
LPKNRRQWPPGPPIEATGSDSDCDRAFRASFYADDSVRKNPLFILTNRRDEVSIFRSLRDRLRSKIAQMPVVTASFEEPKTPDLVLQTDRISVDESVSRIVELMKWRGYRQGGAGRVHWAYLIGATIDRA